MHNPAPQETFRLVERLQALAHGFDERWGRLLESRLELSPAQLRLLEWLAANGPSTPGVVSRGLGRTKGNVTGLVKRLVEKGLVERQAMAADRRTIRLVLTGEGHARVVEAQELKESFAGEVTRLNPLHRLALLELLDELAEAALKHPPGRKERGGGETGRRPGAGEPAPKERGSKNRKPLKRSETGRFVRLLEKERRGRYIQI